MQPVVELENVSKYFERGFIKKERVHAVIDSSLIMNKGEILAVVGESGCGKTTLGKIAVGIIKPTSGKVLWTGKDVWAIPRREFKKMRPRMQIIHQDPYSSLNPVRTVSQTLGALVTHYKMARGRSETQAKVKEILEYVGITPADYFMNKYPHHLSGGMKQRLSIARALVLEPMLIMADEPVTMIDASLRLSILDLMMRLNKELGVAFLCILHDLASARYFARDGKIAIMYLGRIVEVGTTEEVLENPLHPYLRAILSAMPVPDPRIARKRKLIALRSYELPSPTHLPKGCAFNTRCPYAREECFNTLPELRDVGGSHLIACHLTGQLPEWTPPWEVA